MNTPATRKPASLDQERTILQLAFIKDIGDSYHRLRWPASQLAAQAPNWRIINLASNAREHYAWAEKADLLVISQSRDIDLLPIIARRRERGLMTLAEYNDNFYDPPPSSNVAETWQSPLVWQCYESIMNACDAVIVTGPGLQQLLASKTTRPIHILENHHPWPLPAFDAVWSMPEDHFSIGWGGSSGHIADFLSITPLLRDLAHEHPRLRLHIMGDSPLAHYTHMNKAQLVYRAWGSMDQYFDFLRPLKLGLAPLIDTGFNRCRSDIKAIEMGSQGVLPLLPDRLPYHKILAETRMTPYRTHQELRQKILFYMENPSALQEHAHCLYEYIQQHRLGPQRHERLALYSEMMTADPLHARWELPVGYHEIHGTRAEHIPTTRIMQRASELIKQQDLNAAQHLVHEAVTYNPQHADLVLAEIRILAMMQNPVWHDKLNEARSRFPEDLRFDLFELRHESDHANLQTLWHAFLQRLQQTSPVSQKFFGAETAAILCEHLHGEPAFLEIAETCLALYPTAYALKHAVAQTLERRQDFVKALQYFEELLAAQKCHASNQAFLSGTTDAWLDTWLNTLTERLGAVRCP